MEGEELPTSVVSNPFADGNPDDVIEEEDLPFIRYKPPPDEETPESIRTGLSCPFIHWILSDHPQWKHGLWTFPNHATSGLSSSTPLVHTLVSPLLIPRQMDQASKARVSGCCSSQTHSKEPSDRRNLSAPQHFFNIPVPP